MSVKSVLNNFNMSFLVCGIGSINYNKSNFKTAMIFYVLRCMLISAGLFVFYRINLWAIKTDPEMSELTSLIFISCFEITMVGKFTSQIWRIFFDKQLSVVLTTLETIHEKLIRLNVVGPMKIKMNWFYIIGIIVNCIPNIIAPIIWLIISYQNIEKMTMVCVMITNICQCVVFYEYILLILYIKWIAYMINEQIPKRRSCLSTFRDLSLEVKECLNEVNISIHGLPAIVFIASNVAEIIHILYSHLLFPRVYSSDFYFLLPYSCMVMLERSANVILLYRIGCVTEKEIKFFMLRRLHEHYHFKLYGICEISSRQLLIMSNKAFAYLIVQILFKLNK